VSGYCDPPVCGHGHRYSLVRFHKPRRVLEVGAGYTTLFILQALRDNEAE
jgi:hypothetical protein